MLRAALRRSVRPFVALLVFACTLPAFGAMAAPPASASQTAAVQAHLLWSQYDEADRERQLDRVKAAGVGMVRVDVGWASLEDAGKGRWNDWYLDKVDHVVHAAEERDIEVLFTFWETPCWASTAPASLKGGCEGAWWDRDVQRYPPANADDYADALAFTPTRTSPSPKPCWPSGSAATSTRGPCTPTARTARRCIPASPAGSRRASPTACPPSATPSSVTERPSRSG
jgi:hypothetical protein